MIVFLCSERAVLRHRRRLERRRRHRPDHHLAWRLDAGARREGRGRLRARVREQEERGSRRSPCARTRRADGCAPEEECRVRTPFQRDRDRIVHSKPFRRLKGKTQVFIDPAGDHYRTRMTHTLETTAISRVVARALRLNEDLVEAIGLGHDMGHPPFGHAGEDALDDAPARALRPPLPPQRAVAPHRRGAEPHRTRCATGSSRTRASSEPRDARGQDRRIVDRVAYINHDIDDAVRFGLLDAGRAAARGDRAARRDRLGADRHARPRPRRDLRAGRRHPPERRGRGGDARRCASFMFERVYLGPQARAEHERAHEIVRRIFEHLAERGDEPSSRSSTSSPA